MKPEELIDFAKKNHVKIVDFRFTDMPGAWQHVSIPLEELAEGLFEEGVGFDGSSIRGFQKIYESDMLLIPDPATAFLDPFTAIPTLAMICNLKDPVTLEMYSRDPRYVAQKAQTWLLSTGIADAAYFGPEAEFYILDDVRFDQSYNFGYYYLDSKEGFWSSGREEHPNLGYKVRYKEGYVPVPPMDSYQDLRSQMLLNMKKMGIEAEVHHHEVGTAGQAEIDIRYGPLLQTADRLMQFKYVVKNTARNHGKTVTFMPKPIFMDNGSGMHTHQSLFKGGRNLFFEAGTYGDISQLASYYIGGLIHHARSLMALCAPTTNSYRRLVAGYEAPVNLIYSQRNRSACIRIPMYSREEGTKRIEFRPPDPSCNPYLALSAMLMAGLDGVQNRITPPPPIDKNLYDLEPEEKAQVKGIPSSLEEALDALEADHDYLLRGDVFTTDVIETWLTYKRQREVEEVRCRPHPWEFALYFDV